MQKQEKLTPVWLMQPVPYFGEEIGKGWIVEPKIDGWRMQIISRPNGKVEFWGRRLGKKPNWTKKLKNLAEQTSKFLEPGILIDAELYAEGGRRFIPSVLAKDKKARPLIYVFDVIYLRGIFVGNFPLSKRKQLLKKIFWKPPFHVLADFPHQNLKKELRAALKKGYEGIILKKRNSKYLIGKECPYTSEDWKKIKKDD